MALQRDARYPGRWTAASGGHPQGAFKNRTAPGSLDGSYIEQDWANDWDGYFSSLLAAGGLTANGNVDAVGASQYFTALQTMLNTAGGMLSPRRQVRAALAAAAASVTITADEVVVKTALGGSSYILPTFSQVINVSTTGAGGMNTGSAPVSGYVAIYAIYNPTTNTRSTLAVNATSAAQPEIIGVAMPSGYTASALLAVWPTTAASLLIAGLLRGRRFSRVAITVLNTSVGAGSLTTLSIAAAVPLNAISCAGDVLITSAAGSNNNATIASDSLGVGYQYTSQGPGTGMSGNFAVDLTTAQTIFYQMTVTAAPGNFTILLSSYEF
jgi:hypothetical protein